MVDLLESLAALSGDNELFSWGIIAAFYPAVAHP